jgi:hypothetical protein
VELAAGPGRRDVAPAAVNSHVVGGFQRRDPPDRLVGWPEARAAAENGRLGHEMKARSWVGVIYEKSIENIWIIYWTDRRGELPSAT